MINFFTGIVSTSMLLYPSSRKRPRRVSLSLSARAPRPAKIIEGGSRVWENIRILVTGTGHVPLSSFASWPLTTTTKDDDAPIKGSPDQPAALTKSRRSENEHRTFRHRFCGCSSAQSARYGCRFRWQSFGQSRSGRCSALRQSRSGASQADSLEIEGLTLRPRIFVRTRKHGLSSRITSY